MGPTWGPPGPSRPQMGPMLDPWTLLSGKWSYLGERGWFGMLPGSSWPPILHCFCLIGPGWITLLAPSIRHIAFGYARNCAVRVPNIFQDFSDSKEAVYNQILRWHWTILLVHVTSLWCQLIIGTWVTVSIAIFVSGSAECKNSLGRSINKPSHPHWRGERVGLLCVLLLWHSLRYWV